MITRSNLAEQLREYQIRSKYDTSSFFFFLSPSSSSSPNSIFSSVGACLERVSYWGELKSVLGVSGFAILQTLPVVMSSLGRVDVVIFVIWELVILAFLVFAAISLYFRHMKLAFILVCVTLLLFVCMKIAKQVRLARKKKRRMLLPLSM